jgi:hypothetical protein
MLSELFKNHRNPENLMGKGGEIDSSSSEICPYKMLPRSAILKSNRGWKKRRAISLSKTGNHS